MPDLHLGIRNTRQSMDKLGIVLHDTGYIHLPAADESYFWMLHLRSHLWKDEYPIHTWSHLGPDSQPSLVSSFCKRFARFLCLKAFKPNLSFYEARCVAKIIENPITCYCWCTKSYTTRKVLLSHNRSVSTFSSGCRILSIQRITE